MNIFKAISIAILPVTFLINIPFIQADTNKTVANCPIGTGLQFHQLATQYVGYWHGYLSDGTAIESETMTIPYQVYNDGYSVEFNNQISSNGFTACVYYLQDNKNKIKMPVFNVSSIMHH